MGMGSNRIVHDDGVLKNRGKADGYVIVNVDIDINEKKKNDSHLQVGTLLVPHKPGNHGNTLTDHASAVDAIGGICRSRPKGRIVVATPRHFR